MKSSKKVRLKKELYRGLLTYNVIVYAILIMIVAYSWLSIVFMTEPQVDFLEDYERTLRYVAICLGGIIIPISIVGWAYSLGHLKKFLKRKLKELENVY
jgi:hypothetical protein